MVVLDCTQPYVPDEYFEFELPDLETLEEPVYGAADLPPCPSSSSSSSPLLSSSSSRARSLLRWTSGLVVCVLLASLLNDGVDRVDGDAVYACIALFFGGMMITTCA